MFLEALTLRVAQIFEGHESLGKIIVVVCSIQCHHPTPNRRVVGREEDELDEQVREKGERQADKESLVDLGTVCRHTQSKVTNLQLQLCLSLKCSASSQKLTLNQAVLRNACRPEGTTNALYWILCVVIIHHKNALFTITALPISLEMRILIIFEGVLG